MFKILLTCLLALTLCTVEGATVPQGMQGFVIQHTFNGKLQEDIPIDLAGATTQTLPAPVGMHSFRMAPVEVTPLGVVKVGRYSHPITATILAPRTFILTCRFTGCTMEID